MFQIRDVGSNDEKQLIADWYLEEWKISKDETFQRLEGIPNQDVLFQRILYEDGTAIATGGLYLRVGIQSRVPKYREISPWIGLMYTKSSHRGKGIGKTLLEDIESLALQRNIPELFLFTHSADRLYRRCGWLDVEEIHNGDKVIHVMNKYLTGRG